MPVRAPAKSLPSYRLVLLQFLCFVMRSVHAPPRQYVHPIPEHVERLARNLSSALAEGPEHVRAQECLHALLLAVLAHDQAEGGDCQEFTDLMARALVLLGIRNTGQWHSPVDLTPVVAKLKWAVRVVVFTEVVVRGKDVQGGREIMR